MKRTSIVRIVGAVAVTLGVSVAMGLPAQAKDGGTASTHGTCSDTSTYKVNATGHKDSIVIKAKVKSTTGGELWAYTVADNGTTVVAGDATTSKNGKLTVRESIPNLEGTDTIDFIATDSATGESCVAQVVYDKS